MFVLFLTESDRVCAVPCGLDISGGLVRRGWGFHIPAAGEKSGLRQRGPPAALYIHGWQR